MMDQPGMLVLLVNTESPAWEAQMKVGDILLEINGKEVNTIGDYRIAIDNLNDKVAEVIVDRKGQTLRLHVHF